MRLPLIFALTTLTLCGQEFEVVSIKPNKSQSKGSHSNTDQGRLTAVNVSLRSLLVRAYGLKDFQVEGPDWLGAERYDIVATFPEGLPKNGEAHTAALGAMMRKMLADRFRLAVHREQKTFTVYGLVVGKSGIRFREVPDSGSHNQNNDNTRYTGTCVSMDAFAGFLSRQRDLPVDLPVLDMTGLKGFYDLSLSWVPEPKPSDDGRGDFPVGDGSAGPTLAVALEEQLGLRLETRKAPIEILVVEHAERGPSEN